MTVLVDTTVWSLALRRRRGQLNPHEQYIVDQWADLIRNGQAALVGPIRQEILSGIRQETDCETLRDRLAAFDDLPVLTADYEHAARLFNRCRNRGVTGTPTDLLICAVAQRMGLAIFTIDRDFERYSTHLPILLFSS